MDKLKEEIISFLNAQGSVVLTSIDKEGFPHSACKGIVKIDDKSRIYLLDVYQGKTLENLKRNPFASITAFNEHDFVGYCLKGKAHLIPKEELGLDIVKSWDDKITSRATQRLVKNIREEKISLSHPEVALPKPKYMIMIEIQEVVDLTPQHLKKG